MKWFQLISYTTDHCDGDLIAPAVWPVHLNIVDVVNELMKELRSDIAQSSAKGHVTVDYRRKGEWSEPCELSNTGAKVLTLYSAHTVSKRDFEAGETYLSLMARNLAALREAMN